MSSIYQKFLDSNIEIVIIYGSIGSLILQIFIIYHKKMKKLLKFFSFSLILFAFFSSFSSANDCIERTLWNNSICVWIEKESSTRYTLNRSVDCNDDSCAVSCDILLPDNTLTHVGSCNGTFHYNGSSSKKVKLYITINDESDTIEEYYDFGDGSWEGNWWWWSSNNDELEISTDDKNPSVSEYVDLEIDTDEDYVWKVYLTAKYRSSTSSSWSTISNTSSTYFSNRSTAWSNWYISLTSSNNGHKELSNAFKFAKKGYYRITAKDEDWNTDYIDFNVDESSYSDDLELSTNDESPAASEYVDLTVEIDSSYRGKINFSAKYRSSTSSSWTNITRTNSTYFINRSTTWNNWYLTMTSSDHGEKTVENIFKFAKKWYYRIVAEDEDWNSTYLDFNVWYSNTSPLDWFTQKEFEMIERIYSVWPTLISKLKAEYPRLRNSSSWRNLSDELYANMWDVVHKKSNREFQDYDDFDTAFRYWFSRTQDLMD